MPADDGRNYYELLGVEPAASRDEIRRAWRRLARRVHPDVAPDPRSARSFQRVRRAYEVLSEPASRRRYDVTLGLAASGYAADASGVDFNGLCAGLFSGLEAALRATAGLSATLSAGRRRNAG